MKFFHLLATLFLFCCVCYGQPTQKPVAKKQAAKKDTSTKTTPSKAAPTTKFFALTVGSPFTLPECLKRSLAIPTYVPGEPHWCWKDPDGKPKSADPAPEPVNEDVLVHYPPDDA